MNVNRVLVMTMLLVLLVGMMLVYLERPVTGGEIVATALVGLRRALGSGRH
jgi:hypothetical protein